MGALLAPAFLSGLVGKGTEKKVFFFPRGSAVRKLRKLRLVCTELLRVLKQSFRGKNQQNDLCKKHRTKGFFLKKRAGNLILPQPRK